MGLQRIMTGLAVGALDGYLAHYNQPVIGGWPWYGFVSGTTLAVYTCADQCRTEKAEALVQESTFYINNEGRDVHTYDGRLYSSLDAEEQQRFQHSVHVRKLIGENFLEKYSPKKQLAAPALAMVVGYTLGHLAAKYPDFI